MIDGSEDYLISDKMHALAGDEMVIFRKELITSQPVKKSCESHYHPKASKKKKMFKELSS